MAAIDRLTEIFSQFPGIGPRQSKRFVYFLLTRNGNYIENFIRLLSELKSEIAQCDRCFRFFHKHGKSVSRCPICSDTRRDSSLLLIASHDVDLENIEKSHVYDGYYFVLGGTVPILEKEPEKRVRSKELLRRVEKSNQEHPIKEIILAMNANPEGENTAEYIKTILAPITENSGIKISTLGRGLSTGTELEYSDDDTIKNALKNRT